jgi:hypothetical protein
VASRNLWNITGSGTPKKSHSAYPCEVAGGSSPAEPLEDSSPAEAPGSLAAGTWRPGRALRVAASALVEVAYAVVAPRKPMGKRGPETERSPARVDVVLLVSASHCEATRVACRRSDRACRERWTERRQRRRTCSVRASRCRCRSDACGGDRDGPGLAPRTEFLTVGEAHEVAVPRSLEVQAPGPDFESGLEGVRAAHGVPLAAVLGANHHREGR